MTLPREYSGQACSIARALEVVGERWTLLIVRDAFFGVRRFSDFAAHLDIPRAVLTDRLGFLVEHGVLERVPAGGREEYVLSGKGRRLWPVMRALAGWGDDFYAPAGPRRVLRHAGCGGAVDRAGRCGGCGADTAVEELEVAPGPGLAAERPGTDRVSRALGQPHRLLEPLLGADA